MASDADEADLPVNSGSFVAVILTVFTLIGAALGYLNSICVARIIGSEGYQNYAVIIATVCILATLSEAGVGKLAMKLMPLYESQRRRDLLAGYWRYAFVSCLLASIVVAVTVYFIVSRPGESAIRTAAIVGLCSLPIIALSGVAIDFVMACRAPILGTLVARLITPLTTLGTLLLMQSLFGVDTSAVAVTCFAVGSLVGLAVSASALTHFARGKKSKARPEYNIPVWLRDSLSLALFGFLSTWMFRVSLIVLKLLNVETSQISQFSAAMETGLLILLLSKSTDKLFQPYISMVIERREFEQGRRLRNIRYRFVGSFCLLFIVVIAVFGEQILSLYGEEFRGGYRSLLLISIGTSIWTLFSVAPVYLQFTGQRAIALAGTLIGALMLLVLSWALGERYGATGVSIAFCVVTSCLSSLFVVLATRHFNHLSRSPARANP